MAQPGGFNRILTLLRKERGLTQREAAADLGISQALLSHYEKGIRECGLDFVVRAADFYDVSCDYLLGRTPMRNGATLTVDDLPDGDPKDDNRMKGSVLPVMNKRLLTNSVQILYDLLLRVESKTLVTEISNYLMTAFYRIFRLLYTSCPQNQKTFFTSPDQLYQGYSDASMKRSEARIEAMLSGAKVAGIEQAGGIEKLYLTTEMLQNEYPQSSTALLNLIKFTEKNMTK